MSEYQQDYFDYDSPLRIDHYLGLIAKISGIITNNALVAQWIEYLTSNQLVARSTRAGGTKYGAFF